MNVTPPPPLRAQEVQQQIELLRAHSSEVLPGALSMPSVSAGGGGRRRLRHPSRFGIGLGAVWVGCSWGWCLQPHPPTRLCSCSSPCRATVSLRDWFNVNPPTRTSRGTTAPAPHAPSPPHSVSALPCFQACPFLSIPLTATPRLGLLVFVWDGRFPKHLCNPRLRAPPLSSPLLNACLSPSSPLLSLPFVPPPPKLPVRTAC